MSAYDGVNGECRQANPTLLTTILKEIRVGGLRA